MSSFSASSSPPSPSPPARSFPRADESIAFARTVANGGRERPLGVGTTRETTSSPSPSPTMDTDGPSRLRRDVDGIASSASR